MNPILDVCAAFHTLIFAVSCGSRAEVLTERRQVPPLYALDVAFAVPTCATLGETASTARVRFPLSLECWFCQSRKLRNQFQSEAHTVPLFLEYWLHMYDSSESVPRESLCCNPAPYAVFLVFLRVRNSERSGPRER